MFREVVLVLLQQVDHLSKLGRVEGEGAGGRALFSARGSGGIRRGSEVGVGGDEVTGEGGGVVSEHGAGVEDLGVDLRKVDVSG